MSALPAKLRTEQVIPSFYLPSARGATIGPRTYQRRRNLVLFFFHDGQCQVCQALLEEFARRYQDIQDANAEVMAVSTVSAEQARAIAADLNLPFPLLYDPPGSVVDRFTYSDPSTRRPVPVIVVTDRFGAVYTSIQVDEAQPPTVEEVLAWLRFIELQCPE